MLHSWETHHELFDTLSLADLRQYFEQYPNELERRDCCDDTPLITACARGPLETIALLLELGAQVNVVTSAGDTPFTSAIENHTWETSVAICENLLDAGADIEFRGTAMQAPLHSAVKSGKIELVRFLLDRGANVNALREDEETPLMAEILATRPDVRMVRLLIQRGTNLAQRDSWGRTALEMAEQFGKLEVAELLRRATPK